MKNTASNGKIAALKKYFNNRDDISFAFLFGSQAKESAGKISDWDVAVYFKPQAPGEVEWEEKDLDYPQETAIWGNLVDTLKTDNVDLITLNRCPSNIAASAISGMPLVIKDSGLFLEFTIRTHRQAEDYRQFVDSYYHVYFRSSSLSQQDREKLQKIMFFLEEQWGLYGYFSPFTFKVYQDIYKRMEIERWVENMMNSAIDIGEIVLACEKKRAPDYYKDIFIQLQFLPGFKLLDVEKFTEWVKLRNILAHEYLDIRWRRIEGFLKGCKPAFDEFIKSAKGFVNK